MVQWPFGVIEDRFYQDDSGAIWPYSVCRFSFNRIRLGGNLVVSLKGKNALLLEAVAGNFTLGSNLYANGGHSNEDIGGLGILGGYDGTGGRQFDREWQVHPTNPLIGGHGTL